MIKSEELKRGTITRAADDEPLFVIRAKDKLGPTTVRVWAALAVEEDVPQEKIDEALELAEQMIAWQGIHGKKVPD